MRRDWRGCGHLAPVLLLPHVQRQEERRPLPELLPELLLPLLARLRVQVRHDDPGPRPQHHPRHRQPDTIRRTRDQEVLTLHLGLRIARFVSFHFANTMYIRTQ